MRNDRLKALREKKGITQDDLAELAGLSLRHLQRCEGGTSDPTADKIAQIARVLDTSADYLLGLIDDPLPYAQYHADLNTQEKQVISAWRRGDIAEAIKVIVSE